MSHTPFVRLILEEPLHDCLIHVYDTDLCDISYRPHLGLDQRLHGHSMENLDSYDDELAGELEELLRDVNLCNGDNSPVMTEKLHKVNPIIRVTNAEVSI